MKKKLVAMLIDEEQEKAILPLIQGAVAVAFEVETDTATREGLLTKINLGALSISQFLDSGGFKNDPKIVYPKGMEKP